jgi:hypothetical protein
MGVFVFKALFKLKFLGWCILPACQKKAGKQDHILKPISPRNELFILTAFSKLKFWE